MQQLILEHWNFYSPKTTHQIVVPDGCRDLIFLTDRNGQQEIKITEIDTCAYGVESTAGDHYEGFRFRPDCVIDEDKLFHYLNASQLTPDHPTLLSIIHDTVRVETQLAETMQSLRLADSLTQASQELGVSVRTLERLVKSKTGKSPLFWLRLLRMRRTASTLLACEHLSLTEVALDNGYCDQSHMSREFQHWLGITPAALCSNVHWQQAFGEGYD
ncbi:helix-turn-helix domain-containing protein [Serratia sp. (in: enterobacteria)]|uniref:AraC family transcriptional regulator n=1 Tax=Serratia sp. (in: enterobacteria) TaxID=616 RepID=UPI0039893417